MYVTTSSRGKGIGNQLLNVALENAKHFGLEGVNLSVVTTNTSAVTLYERVGFTIYGTEKRALKIENTYYDEYLMELTFT